MWPILREVRCDHMAPRSSRRTASGSGSERKENVVEGILLIVVYAAIASVGEAGAMGIGFILDKISPAASTIVFMVNSAIVLGVAWPIALHATRSRDE
jgi:hypothetical protein